MFDLPFGPFDPRLLTELLRKQMGSPGLVPGPVPAVSSSPATGRRRADRQACLSRRRCRASISRAAWTR